MSDFDLVDMYYEPESRIGTILVVENNRVIPKKYCLNCGSLSIKVSAKGNEYCSEICWDKTQTNLTNRGGSKR